jgi:hypothetical protein
MKKIFGTGTGVGIALLAGFTTPPAHADFRLPQLRLTADTLQSPPKDLGNLAAKDAKSVLGALQVGVGGLGVEPRRPDPLAEALRQSLTGSFNDLIDPLVVPNGTPYFAAGPSGPLPPEIPDPTEMPWSDLPTYPEMNPNTDPVPPIWAVPEMDLD